MQRCLQRWSCLRTRHFATIAAGQAVFALWNPPAVMRAAPLITAHVADIESVQHLVAEVQLLLAVSDKSSVDVLHRSDAASPPAVSVSIPVEQGASSDVSLSTAAAPPPPSVATIVSEDRALSSRRPEGAAEQTERITVKLLKRPPKRVTTPDSAPVASPPQPPPSTDSDSASPRKRVVLRVR